MFIDAWWIPLSVAAEACLETNSILSAEERQRASRFRFPKHARRFQLCHLALRLVLAWHLEQQPRAIDLVFDSRGKPRLAGDSTVRFNLSHSGDVVLIAVTSGLEVGVDVEAIQPTFPVKEVGRLFTPQERKVLSDADAGEVQARAFFRLWTRKEAVLKAEGSGLLGDLKNLDISMCPPEAVRFPARGTKWWRVENLQVAPGYEAALAAPAGEWEVRWRGTSA